MTRALKLLRWSVSIVAFTACLLMGMLWVRSYWRADVIAWTRSPGRTLSFQSGLGATGVLVYSHRNLSGRRTLSFDSLSQRSKRVNPDLIGIGNLRRVRITRLPIIVPHWVWMVLFGMLAAAPWLRWRFSVRGVLVLMAFLAAMFAILRFE